MTKTNEARIETSTVCNYNCIFCPHNKLTRKKEFMSMELFKNIISKLPSNIKVLTLSGLGEMFLDPTIYEKIKYVKEKGYIVNALSNASNIDIDKLLKSNIDSIRISFHASNRNKYKEITNNDSYEIALNNIKLLTKTNIKVIITVDVIEEDKEEINKLKEMFKDVDLLEIWKVHNWAGEFNYRKGEKKKLTCGRPFNGPLQIQVDGTINMCCFDYDGKLTLGDLKTQSINEIFESEMYKEIVKFHTISESSKDLLCKKCDQLYEKDSSILLYNSKFGEERINKLSTTYEEL